MSSSLPIIRLIAELKDPFSLNHNQSKMVSSLTTCTPYQTPQPPPQSTIPPPPPSAPRTSRPPLESVKTILSPETFKQRHLREFAHLHDDANKSDLRREEEILAEERRVGRMLRESGVVEKVLPSRASSVDGTAGNGRRGTRPLSLVLKRQGHKRSATTEIGLGIEMLGNQVLTQDKQRPASISYSRPRSLRSSLVLPSISARHDLIPEEQSLEVLVDQSGSQSPSTAASHRYSVQSGYSAEARSGNTSTYSWATSFSGETTDLRTAAHYVPPTSSRAGTPEREASQVPLDSPARKEQRRKRIVAIAHTVRQLEGVGSRDLEDPTFYSVLERAWYERFDDKRKPQLQSPAQLPPTPSYYNDAVAPFAPESESSQMALRRYPIASQQGHIVGAADGSPTDWASPPDPEFQTPHQGYTFSSVHHDYPVPRSHPRQESLVASASNDSRSVRYSYASSLHDLDGIAQGAKLMQEKAWLKSRSFTGTPWGGDFDMPPPLRAVTPEEEAVEHTNSRLDSPFNYDSYPRTLRRVDNQIGRPLVQRVVSDEKPPLESPARIGPNESGPKWGVGMVSAWWEATPATRASSPINEGQADFRLGEDGNIPIMNKPSRNKRSMSTTSSVAVLEPETTLPSLQSLNPSERMFIESLLRIPDRRRSFPMSRRIVADASRSDGHRPSLSRSLRTRRTRSEIIWTRPPRNVRDGSRRSSHGRTASVCSNHCHVRLAPTHSITSSPLPPAPPPSHETAASTASEAMSSNDGVEEVGRQGEKAEIVEANQSVESDGSIGLETLSLRSISPLPSPLSPLDNAPFHCLIPPIYPLHQNQQEPYDLSIPHEQDHPDQERSHGLRPWSMSIDQDDTAVPTLATEPRLISGDMARATEMNAVTTAMPSIQTELEESRIHTEPLCPPPATPTRSSSLLPSSANSSYPPWSDTVYPPAPTLAPVQPAPPAQSVQAPRPTVAPILTRLPSHTTADLTCTTPTRSIMPIATSSPIRTPTRDRPAERENEVIGLPSPSKIRDSTFTRFPVFVDDAPVERQPRIQEIANAQTQIRVHTRSQSASSSRTLFWLGFILPFLWIFGAFGFSTTNATGVASTDLESGVSTREKIATKRKADRGDRGWWSRWAYHPDPYVERCRIALGVAVPVGVVGGVVAACVVALA